MRISHCARCGCELPYDAPEGLCPRCVMGLAADRSWGSIAETEFSNSSWVPPKPEALAPYFPNLDILDLIGQGGMGAVYKARQKGLDRIVALKILPPHFATDPAFSERFHRESRALARLNHPNIVTVYDSGESGGLFFFLMEYVDGVNLRQAMRNQRLTSKEALAIVPQICDALQYAHEVGIVHRDIKPENVLLDVRGRIKIADFGLAKLLGQSSNQFMLTATHQVMGTPRYMAPEQLEGTEIDHRADIYSLGVVFYELLTGELPLGRFAPPSRKAQLDARLDEVVLKTLEKEPRLRYQHANELKSDIQTLDSPMLRMPAKYLGREYRSRTTLFGVPLFHYATGINPQTGRKRVAKGVIAVGDIAVGGVAVGGVTVGGIALGGVSFGLCTFGGIAIGLLLALGGCAVGGWAMGGVAFGGVAIGGSAIGYYAVGGSAVGMHTFSPMRRDPAAVDFFMDLKLLATSNVRFLTLVAVGAVTCISILGGFLGILRRLQEGTSRDDSAKYREESGVSGVAILSAILLTGLLFAIGVASIGYLVFAKRQAAMMEETRARLVADQLLAKERAAFERAALERAAAARVALERTTVGQDRANVRANDTLWIWKDNVPRLRPFAELKDIVLLPQEKETEINDAIAASYREYVEIQSRYLPTEAENDSNQVAASKMLDEELKNLEMRLWSQLDTALSRPEQAELRKRLDVRAMFRSRPVDLGR